MADFLLAIWSHSVMVGVGIELPNKPSADEGEFDPDAGEPTYGTVSEFGMTELAEAPEL